MTCHNRWLCVGCEWRGSDAKRLFAPDPFNAGSTVYACPICREMALIVACEVEGCTMAPSCGTPTDSGYRVTCSRHAPKESMP